MADGPQRFSRPCWRLRRAAASLPAVQGGASRHRPRPPGPGVVRDRQAGAPTADAGLARVPGPRLVGRSLRSSAVVDNDVNLMAFGEQQTWFDDCAHLLFVKVGAGIGCGSRRTAGSCAERMARPATSATCESPATTTSAATAATRGCLEAVAGGAAIAARLAEAGRDAAGSADIVRLVHGRPARQPARPRGGSLRGRGARTLRQPLQPWSDRHRRPPHAGTAALAGRCARSDDRALAALWPRATCGWCRAGSGSARESSAPASCCASTSSHRPRSTAPRAPHGAAGAAPALTTVSPETLVPANVEVCLESILGGNARWLWSRPRSAALPWDTGRREGVGLNRVSMGSGKTILPCSAGFCLWSVGIDEVLLDNRHKSI